MKSYSVFLVSHKNLDSIKLIDAAFDSREKAEAYANRYKTHQEPDIAEIMVNPSYHADPTQDCYYLEFNKEDRSVADCHISNTLESAERALSGAYSTETINNTDRICIAVFAASEKEAIINGLKTLSTIRL